VEAYYPHIIYYITLHFVTHSLFCYPFTYKATLVTKFLNTESLPEQQLSSKVKTPISIAFHTKRIQFTLNKEPRNPAQMHSHIFNDFFKW